MKKKVLIIGSGPIKIGQAAEFDYSGTQASIALQEEGYAAVVLNPNPATIQTDIDFASAVYIQALTVENLEYLIKKEKVWGVVPTFGGQAGLNLATQADEVGIFKKYGVRVLGTNMDAIKKGEDREVFRKITQEIGLHVLPSKGVTSVKAAQDFAKKIGFPVIVRAAYTLGGSGSGMANDKKALDSLISEALKLSPIGQALVEKSIFGGKEFEYEIVRDSDGNKLCICTMENLDPMGIHTGDSIVVSPIQTVPDVEVQYMRDASFKIVDALGIQGACNVQFGYDYKSKKYYIIEVNPRLSRSSALASKATGYPIARMAAKIAIGKTLPQLKNPITGKSAFFEPALDYVVVKIPRWPFDKFHQLDKNLGVGMKSTGETMAIGRTFEEAIYKAVESLDFPTNYWGLCDKDSKPQLLEKLSTPTHERLSAIKRALVLKISPTEISKVSNIHPWFINKLESMFAHDFESKVISGYKLVDTCAGEFLAHTPYYYSTFLGGAKDIISKSKKPKVVIVGSGPIRIGQGIEFDYSCVHAVLAAKKMGFETVVINNNPETVSTDFSISDRLYFEPLTTKFVLNVLETEKENLVGVLLLFGGQTALKLSSTIEQAGYPILGPSMRVIDICEDRLKTAQLLKKLNIPYPNGTLTFNKKELDLAVKKYRYSCLIRPSYVLAGEGMAIIADKGSYQEYLKNLQPHLFIKGIFVDEFVSQGKEVDVDVVADGASCYSVLLEQLEDAGVHSGDSHCVYPPQNLSKSQISTIDDYTKKIVKELKFVGALNIQMICKGDKVFVIEINPRASRTLPFCSKAVGIPLAKVATGLVLGKKLADFKLISTNIQTHIKKPIFSFDKLVGLSHDLGPMMYSTGEVMVSGSDYKAAHSKLATDYPYKD